MLPHFNLSRNKSLRTLETTGESIHNAGCTASTFLKTVLSSVTSSASLDVVIIYQDREICGPSNVISEPFCHDHSSQKVWDRQSMYYQQQLGVLRDMYNTRNFRLVLCADVPHFMVEHALEILRRVVEAGKVTRGFGHLHEPLVISERRTFHTRYGDKKPGWAWKLYIPATTL